VDLRVQKKGALSQKLPNQWIERHQGKRKQKKKKKRKRNHKYAGLATTWGKRSTRRKNVLSPEEGRTHRRKASGKITRLIEKRMFRLSIIGPAGGTGHSGGSGHKKINTRVYEGWREREKILPSGVGITTSHREKGGAYLSPSHGLKVQG